MKNLREVPSETAGDPDVNWAEIVGTVQLVTPHPSLTDFSVVTVLVESVSDVEGYRNDLSSIRGQIAEVNVRRERLARAPIRLGGKITFRARRGHPGVIFAHPDSF